MTTLLQRTTVGMLLTIGLIGCKDLAGTPPLPAGTSSPGVVQNAEGAVQTAVAAQVIFQQAFADYIPIAGELTDELQVNGRDIALTPTGGYQTAVWHDVMVDSRQLDQASDWNPPVGVFGGSTDTVYARLQMVRSFAYQAIGGLAAYAPDSVALRGTMYALVGYAELMLADLYCSGVPLSTLDFQGDYTYRPGSTTAQVYTHAITMFDTAITLATTNSQVTNLAKVGQGRAYLALGDYARAGQAVNAVPATFQFADSVVTCGAVVNDCSTIDGNVLQSARFVLKYVNNFGGGYSVSDMEGGVGLPFRSSNDTRTADTVVGQSAGGTASQYVPSKYHVTGVNALVLASGLEAQLITAEAELNAGNAAGMFTILNALRTSSPVTAGKLPPLTDPGTFGAEVDSLFTERAAWLFVDGHRQGDLRRLMRNYVNGQGVTVVANQYPTGDYGYGVGFYGGFIDAPVPAAELNNPQFTGCLSRD